MKTTLESLDKTFTALNQPFVAIRLQKMEFYATRLAWDLMQAEHRGHIEQLAKEIYSETMRGLA